MYWKFSSSAIDWLEKIGLDKATAINFWNMTDFLFVLILSIILYYIAKWIIGSVLKHIARRTTTVWDDILYDYKVFHRMAFLIPGLLIRVMASGTLSEFGPKVVHVAQSLSSIYIISIFMLVILTFFKALDAIYQTLSVSKYRPIKPFLQVAAIIVYIIGGLLILAYVMGEKPVTFLAGLGAASAILMFVFKDAILGLVGGIQLSANDMVRPGDYISMPKYGADGNVLEITLTTVKVRNGDMTITTVPTYALVSDSFQNFRGMAEADGRRIKRSVLINVNSIKFCTPEMIKRFGKMQLISEYIAAKEAELKAYNEQKNIDDTVTVNSRKQTNLGVFMAYLRAYLQNNPNLNSNMDMIVRQLQPTETGIPIEVYAFSKIKSWAEYEAIQANLFNHILAVVPEFDLQVFQRPSGTEVRLMDYKN
ncbi:MAG: mechanosensitive ion channel [Bacteroidota bacterium]|nr:mechanosensitive ion channel [Bacteroidota bacterium]